METGGGAGEGMVRTRRDRAESGGREDQTIPLRKLLEVRELFFFYGYGESEERIESSRRRKGGLSINSQML